MSDHTLELRQRIEAPPPRVFAAWTSPEALKQWWGPEGITCPEAEIDLRVGGAHGIANLTPGGVVWIRGEFLEIDPPHRLVYSWSMGGERPFLERVTVRFVPVGAGTEVVVLHEHIADEASRDDHLAGWQGCLAGLAALDLS